MKVLTILGTSHKGNTRAIVDLFLDEFKEKNNTFDEIVLPKDFNDICLGCANCILNGEDKCPHYKNINPLIKKMEEADLIIIATPIIVESCSSALKAFLDHLAYIWLVHRPKESMYKKTGLIVTTAGGSGVKVTTKLIKNNMFYWGISNIYNYGVTTMKMGGNYSDYKKKDKIKKQVSKKAIKIKRSMKKNKISLKSRLFFHIFKLSQKNGWNKKDVDYWKEKGWLSGKKPY